MKILIIDNEDDIKLSLQQLLLAFCSEEISEIKSANSISDGLNLIHTYQPDLVFLDVELDEGTGFDLLKQLNEIHFQLIFITAHNKYAVEAFRYAAIDFLLKPFNPEHLIESIQRVKASISKNNLKNQLEFLFDRASKNDTKKRIALKTSDQVFFIDIDNIICLKAEGSYTRFYVLNQKPILVSGNLKDYEEILDHNDFIRPHHSYLISLNKVVSFNKRSEEIILQQDVIAQVSVRKREFILSKLGL